MKKKYCVLLFVIAMIAAYVYADEMYILGGKSDEGSPYKFYYEQLDKTEKQAYNCIIDHIYDMPQKIRVPYLDGEQLNNVFESLLFDNPDLFFVGRKCSVTSTFLGDNFTIDYIMDKTEYEKCRKELKKAVDGIIRELPENGDFEKELKIHDYIVDNCVYKNKDDDYIYSSSYGALVNGEAACEGYSKAAKLLLDEAKIENGIVCGKSENEKGEKNAHMWNAVKINDNFYHLDCTWDDPVNESGTNMKSYSHFNLSDEMISSTHSDFSYDFHCFSNEENYYIKNNSYFEHFGTSEKQILRDLIEKAMLNGEKYVQIRFSDSKVYNSAVRRLLKNGDIYDIYDEVKKATKKSFSTNMVRYYENNKQLTLTFVVG